MELLRFIPVRLTLLLVAGILIGRSLDPDPAIALLFAFFAIVFQLVAQVKCTSEYCLGYVMATVLTFLSFGILAYSLSLPKNQKGHYLFQNPVGIKTMQVKVREVLRPTRYYSRYIVQLNSIGKRAVSGKLIMRVQLEDSLDGLQVDEEILVRCKIEPLRPALNPYAFDYRAYLEDLGIYHQLNPRKSGLIVKESRSPTLYGHAAQLREQIIKGLSESGFGLEELAIVKALLLGQRTDIPTETYQNYKNAGAVHILAVSGLHIGILLWLLHVFLRPLERLPNGKIFKLLILLLILWGYALLAGLSASIIRAVSMFSFVAYALYLNRPANSFNILALSMFFLLLLANARLLFQPGFQMSYAAVIAIVWLYPCFQRIWQPGYWLINKTWQLFSVSIAAQLGVLPISLYYFHQFPGLFFVSNLLVVPIMGIILGLGFVIGLFVLLTNLPIWIAEGYELLIRFMNSLIHWVASQEEFIFEDIPFDLTQVALAYFVIISLGLVLKRLNYPRLKLLAVSIVMLQAWNIYLVLDSGHHEKVWILHQWGDTVLMHRQGHHLMAASTSGSFSRGLLKDFRTGEGIREILEVPLHKGYQWDISGLYIIDEKAVLPQESKGNIALLLTNNPRIHLGRILDSINPRLVIADGSNYRSYTSRWKLSCVQRNIPFHDTSEQGAYLWKM